MRILVAVFAVLTVFVTGAAAYAVLSACGLRLPFVGVVTACEDETALATRAALDETLREGDALARRVDFLERELAALECRADPPPPPPPPPPEPETESGLDPDAFEQGDISVMEGCWQLDSNYSVTHIRTKKVTHFRDWRLCFDANGQGREIMRSTDGVRCEGPIRGRLQAGKLVMTEPGNMECDNNTHIFRRDITCALDARGRAQCESYQPEIDGRGRATLRREGR